MHFTRPSVQNEMAAIEEFVQLMKTLQRQQHALNQKTSTLIAAKPTVQKCWLTVTGGDCDCNGTSNSDSDFSNANPRQNERESPVDTKDLGKSPAFKGASARKNTPQFRRAPCSTWTFKREFLESGTDYRRCLHWCLGIRPNMDLTSFGFLSCAVGFLNTDVAECP